MKKKKLKVERIVFIGILFIAAIFFVYTLVQSLDKQNNVTVKMIDLKNKTVVQIEEYATEKKLKLDIQYQYDKTVEKDQLIHQNIPKDEKIREGKMLIVVISKGKISQDVYQEYAVNELGDIPIMMYHGIEKLDKTDYVGGNVDKDGYNRTVDAFKKDLEFYYKNGYRMIRLIDYINGDIDTELGKSPIVLTFDDGNKNNFHVLGKDENGKLKIDPDCAIGILEEFKKKYPDFDVTATFFLMDNLFNQSEYDEEKLKWLVENGYDVGNHTKNHINYKNATSLEAQNATGYMYEKLEKIIPGKYVKIVALPFGSPYEKTHENFQYVLKGSYNGKEYETVGALRVGWMPEVSPYHTKFDPTFMKRVRAYDNNGKEFDIEMVFKGLESSKYISDGDRDTVVVSNSKKDNIKETTKEIITY